MITMSCKCPVKKNSLSCILSCIFFSLCYDHWNRRVYSKLGDSVRHNARRHEHMTRQRGDVWCLNRCICKHRELTVELTRCLLAYTQAWRKPRVVVDGDARVLITLSSWHLQPDDVAMLPSKHFLTDRWERFGCGVLRQRSNRRV